MPRSLATYTALAALTLGALGGVAAAPAFADTAVDPTGPNSAQCLDLQKQAANADQQAANQQNIASAQDTRATTQQAIANQQDALATQQQEAASTADAAGDIAARDAARAAVTAALGARDSARAQVADAIAQRDAARAAAAQAITARDSARSQAVAACAPATAPTPTTSPAVVPHTRSEAFIDGEIDALACGSSNADLQRIDRQIAARQAAKQTVDEVNSRLNAKIASLNCTGTSAVTPKAAAQTAKDCGCVVTSTPDTTVTEAPSETTSVVIAPRTVVPTQDDGSKATTSGNEVTDVPAGSASTGVA